MVYERNRNVFWWANALEDELPDMTVFIQRSLATDLQNISVGLRKKHSSYLNRLRQQKEVCVPKQ